jgi:hypothetical protein
MAGLAWKFTNERAASCRSVQTVGRNLDSPLRPRRIKSEHLTALGDLPQGSLAWRAQPHGGARRARVPPRRTPVGRSIKELIERRSPFLRMLEGTQRQWPREVRMQAEIGSASTYCLRK